MIENNINMANTVEYVMTIKEKMPWQYEPFFKQFDVSLILMFLT